MIFFSIAEGFEFILVLLYDIGTFMNIVLYHKIINEVRKENNNVCVYCNNLIFSFPS